MHSLQTEHLFVYGTVLTAIHHPQHRILQTHAQWVDKGIFQANLYDLGPYPGAVASSDVNDKVYGEVYKLTDLTVLTVLDDYEEYGSPYTPPFLFTREIITVQISNQTLLSCYSYVYNRSVAGYQTIDSGDYLLYRQEKKADR